MTNKGRNHTTLLRSALGQASHSSQYSASHRPGGRARREPDSVKHTAAPALTSLIAGLLTVASATASWAGTTAEWKGGGGAWENAAMWAGTLPSRTTAARVDGTTEHPSDAILAHADVLLNHLGVAESGSSLASLVLDGPSLTVSGSLDVGKYNGSNGRLVVKSGHLF